MTRPLTAGQVAEALGIHPNTVKRIPPDQLPYFRVGTSGIGHRRYEPESVEAYKAMRSGLRMAS